MSPENQIVVVTILLTTTLFLSLSLAEDAESARDPSYLKLMVMHYPHKRIPEPFTYPGPSPPVKYPPRVPEPYMFVQPGAGAGGYPPRPPLALLDYEDLPKWCKNMWDREECGMKCWMLRKICRNIAQQTAIAQSSMKEDFRIDSEGSHSMPRPQLNSIPTSPYYPFYQRPNTPAVSYSKTGVANTYFAQPSWHYPPVRRSPYQFFRHPSTSHSYEIGLNPQFTYVDGSEKLYTTTEKPAKENEVNATQATPAEEATTTTEKPETTTAKRPTPPKGMYAVRVTTAPRYPTDTEVTTLSPLMFEFDQYGNRGYYGDRIYMSAVLPVSDRQQRQQREIPESFSENNDSFDDFDEMMIEP